jgi:cell division protein FtsA
LIAAGVVLTGGTSKMEGAVELAEEIFHMPVRLASPQGVDGLSEIVKNPIYSTGVGLLLYAQKQQQDGSLDNRRKSNVGGTFARMKNWFKENF